jgi:predicted RNA-binding Zn-ribbon protein involved in translation (DUF1610 family)
MSDHTEWLCESCHVVHPIQREGKVLQPCPRCGYAMTPTSQNMRELAALRVEHARLRELIAELDSEIRHNANMRDEFQDWERVYEILAVLAPIAQEPQG